LDPKWGRQRQQRSSMEQLLWFEQALAGRARDHWARDPEHRSLCRGGEFAHLAAGLFLRPVDRPRLRSVGCSNCQGSGRLRVAATSSPPSLYAGVFDMLGDVAAVTPTTIDVACPKCWGRGRYFVLGDQAT